MSGSAPAGAGGEAAPAGAGGEAQQDVRRFVRKGDMLPTAARKGAESNRASLLVVLHPDHCSDCADYCTELESIGSDLQDWGTRVLAVLPADEPGESRDFSVLRDPDGEVRRRLGVRDDEAAVILADRWGEVFEAATIGSDHDFPLPWQLVESAKVLDVSCGECNVPGIEWSQTDT